MAKIHPGKIIPYLSCILVLGFLIVTSFSYGDFKVFLEAAKLLASGKNPYHVWIFLSEGNYALYYYSPLWAAILIPFSHLPAFIPNLIWLLANAWFLYRIWTLLASYIDFRDLSKKQANWLLFLSLMFSVRFILYNFEMIQMTVFLLWGTMESLLFFKKEKFLYGGALLALVINIKILPLVFLPWLIYRRELKGALSTLLFSVLFLFLPVLILGWKANLVMLSEWWTVINPGNAEHLSEPDIGIHSLTALIPSLLTETKGGLPYPRNIVNLDAETTTCILNGIRAGLILFTLYFLKWPPFRQAKSRLYEIYELSYIFLLIPLIFPHQQKYAFFLAFPALFYISYCMILGFTSWNQVLFKKRTYAVASLSLLSFALMTLSTDGIIGRHLNQVTQHYKTITYGAVILIIILILCDPRRIMKNNPE